MVTMEGIKKLQDDQIKGKEAFLKAITNLNTESQESLLALARYMLATAIVQNQLMVLAIESLSNDDKELLKKMRPLLSILEKNPLDIR